ncbi:MAG: putative periplasmic ligand-binding sensor domain protein [Bacteroidetes bacterium]|jgi:serine phosphatase RsbU (regulator of sigma subunit)|nr:putative periplasmic ligand-binding sensor domain protein [Bacteroidota bacterium]
MIRKTLAATLLLLLLTIKTNAQDTTDHLKSHIGFMETFFGDEQDYQVCYPKDHKNFFYSIIVFALLSTSLGALIIIVKTRSNKLLKEKNTIIEEKNHDLVSSITYAKRIQTSILPNPAVLAALGNQLFVLYKPRDIVSGDFYWISQAGDNLYTAVVDCTGHGVPGAFLSLIGHQGLNKAINEDRLTDPARILDSMNSHVKQVLQQEENTEIRDGMEVALCKLNTKTKQLEFAGANLNIVLIRNKEVSVVKGGKCTVGSVQPHVTDLPVTHTIQLDTGDCFYCFSDGYADQMGGEKGKKFMSAKLRELLIGITTNDLEQQCHLLRYEFEKWKGGHEQTDDVCVLGVRA